MTPAQMAALHARAFPRERPWSAAEIAALMDTPGGFAVTGPSGFALGRAIAGEAELLTIAVAPEARRQGRGRALLAAFEAEAARRGAARGFLEVAEDNAAARALYAAAGWQETGRRPGYYALAGGGRVDALLMDKALAR
ncbi:MAG: GNAT family N-acetyltransferase [Alphaproteobacteria bacterium]|nr:MAG: GNAT family N-acetyltransferase [Alphaproteobacteria bacterium]